LLKFSYNEESMKKLFLVLVFLISNLYAESFFNLKVGAYNRTLDDTSYITIAFKPLFMYNGFFGGSSFEFSFKPDSTLKQDEWDNTRAILEKFYFGYGEKESPIVFRFSSLDDVNLGYGILVNKFRNDIYYPTRIKPGLLFNFDYNYFGIESFVDDAYDLDLIGSRLFVRPLSFIKNSIPEYIRDFRIGGFFIADYDNLDKDTSATDYYIFKDDPSSKTVKFYGFDIFVPIFKKDFLYIANWVEYAKMHGYGSGLSYGILLNFLNYFNFKGSLIYSWDGFTPNFFSSFYEVRTVRSTIYDSSILSKDGWNFFDEFWFDYGLLKVGTQFYYTKGNGAFFTFYTYLKPELLKGFFVRIFYSKRDVKSIIDAFNIVIDKDRIITNMEIGYQITRNAYISIRYIKSFKEVDGNISNSSLTEIQTNIVF